MEQSTENTTDVLNDLIQINNDRIEGYQKAKDELNGKEPDLQTLFSDFIAQSREIRDELKSEVELRDEDSADDTTARGKIYRGWMDVRVTFSGHDRKTVLENCERGEDAAQNAYKDALKEDLPENVRMQIKQQKEILNKAHNEVKRLRDSTPDNA
jgi:uncharacterized protein (TIGR02284 family)